MHVPEQLFSLPLLKDVKTQPLELVYRRALGTSLGGQIIQTPTPIYQVPGDRILVITSFAVEVTPDLNGGWVFSVCALIGPDGGTQYAAFPSAGPGANSGTNPNGVAQTYGATGSVWVPPTATVSGYCVLNVPGAHVGYFSMVGITIPRGSVSIG